MNASGTSEIEFGDQVDLLKCRLQEGLDLEARSVTQFRLLCEGSPLGPRLNM